ncbi:NF041680 family putative transposase [Streptacidiphilus pinicola]|uniref:NF041680 family putative transposase n=1 Tax=Streptacidiphilus pinicola TaxID=2219663 RepID=UPI00140357B4|nr:NF041680 family putative transposase [Streptacidiphilus pinicola]
MDVLSRFRVEFYECLYARADALFELIDAVLCKDGPVKTRVEPSLPAEHRRGHGALYQALNAGWIEPARLRRLLGSLPMPRAVDGRIVLAVDVSNWLRPDAETSPDRLFCHIYGRGRSKDQFIPGWPCSFVAVLESGRTSWCRLLDAVRLGPADDAAAVAAAQLREVIQRTITAGHWREGDPDLLIVADAGYDLARLASLLADLPVEVCGRLRSDRVLARDQAPDNAGTRPGRPRMHGAPFSLAKPATWGDAQIETRSETTRYGTATARAWDRLHPRLTRRSAWIEAQSAELPILHGLVVRLTVERLPGGRDPAPLWLWSSRPGADPSHVDQLWQAYLRRFDLEHTFRLLRQTLGWTAPKLREPASAAMWTWLIIVVHTQLWLARSATKDLRRPWERSLPTDKLTPARVRRGLPGHGSAAWRCLRSVARLSCVCALAHTGGPSGAVPSRSGGFRPPEVPGTPSLPGRGGAPRARCPTPAAPWLGG